MQCRVSVAHVLGALMGCWTSEPGSQTRLNRCMIDVHIGVAMPNPEEFMEKLNAEISRHKSSPANIRIHIICLTVY